MSLLTRAAQKIFGSTGGTSEFGQIGSKSAGSPATTKNLETMQALSQYDLGLNAIVSDQGTSVLPYLEDINSLFFLTTSQLAYLMQSGIPEWDDATEYYENISLVLRGGVLWVDTFGTPGTPNLNYDPPTNLDKWRPFSAAAMYADSGSVNSYTLTQVAGASSTVYYNGMKVTFKALNTNTGPVNVNVGLVGVVQITLPGNVALSENQIIAGLYSTIIYNSITGSFELVLVDDQAGDLKMVAKATASHGWLLCDGSAISRAVYAPLFAVIGTTWGVGNGSTTFNIPNGEGIGITGAGVQNVGGNNKGGNALGDTVEDEVQYHYHVKSGPSINYLTSVGGANYNNNLTAPTSSYSQIAIQGMSNDTVSGGGSTIRGGLETTISSMVVNFLIKY